jgi:hypothetical protein
MTSFRRARERSHERPADRLTDRAPSEGPEHPNLDRSEARAHPALSRRAPRSGSGPRSARFEPHRTWR